MKNILLALTICILIPGCGGSKAAKPGISTTETATTSETASAHDAVPGSDAATSGSAQAGGRFAPELLLSDRQTMGLTVEIPQVRGSMPKSPGNFAQLTVVVECASKAAQKEAEGKLAKLSEAVGESLAGKTAEFLESVEGKLKLKEEILWRMQRLMQNKGIKQVYFQEFSVEKQ